MIPISTDAPLYHYPITTVSLITANIICFGMMLTGDPLAWVMEFGTIDPLQWLSSMFAHASVGHLLGNMIFLWAFGVIVEGKIGWLRMFALYMGIGLSQAALIQLIMLPIGGPGALGASSAIMGLMAISMVWAPKNEISIFYFFWFFWVLRVGTFEVTIMTYAIFYLGWDLVNFIIVDSGSMGTAALHLSGAVIGFGAGVLFLKQNWVDCENWDLFRVLKGNYGRFADSSTTVGSHADPQYMFGKNDVSVKDDLPDNSLSKRHQKRLAEVIRMIKDNDCMGASEELLMIRMEDSDATVSEPLLEKLIIGLLRADMPEDAEIYLVEYIERFPDNAGWACVRMAHLLLQLHKRPSAALAMLKQVRLSELSEKMQTRAKKIALAAKKQVRAGVKDARPEW